jgi:chromosome segregation ATPase
MDEIPETEEGIRILRSAIRAREQVIDKQNAKIQSLQNALLSDQQTIRKLETVASERNVQSANYTRNNQMLKSNCDYLDHQVAQATYSLEQANEELAENLGLLGEIQQRHASLTTQLKIAQEGLAESQSRESSLLNKISELTVQKRQLEIANAELQQYQAKAEELYANYDVFKSQIEQLEAVHAKTQQLISERDAQLSALRVDRKELHDKLHSTKSDNKKMTQRIAHLEAKMATMSTDQAQLDSLVAQLSEKDKEIQVCRSTIHGLQGKVKKSQSTSPLIHQLKQRITALEEELKAGRQKLSEAEEQIQTVKAPDVSTQPQYEKLRTKYKNLKQYKANSMEELYSLKLTAARLEGDLESAEKTIVALRNDRDETRAKLVSTEGFLEQCVAKTKQVERESEVLRGRVQAVNANQTDVEAVQQENERLRSRMDHLETDLEAYTERQRRSVIRRRRPRLH